MADEQPKPPSDRLMPNPKHLAKLLEGVKVWNQWRGDNPEVRPELSGMDLRRARIATAEESLREKSFAHQLMTSSVSPICELVPSQEMILRRSRSEMTLALGAPLPDPGELPVAYPRKKSGKPVQTRSSEYDAKLMKVNFTEADLRESILLHADLMKARLRRANLTRAKLQFANLTQADLWAARLCGADLYQADLAHADLRHADLTEARLHGVRNLILDSTIVRNAKFDARAKDPWSVLRRAYTGSRLLFNILLLVAFLIPYVVKTAGWVGVNRLEVRVTGTIGELEYEVERMESASQDRPWHAEPTFRARLQSMKRLLAKAKNALPDKNSPDWKESRVWRLIIGADKGPWYFITAVVLIVYNVLRTTLTWFVAPMRDAEERSGVSPAYRYDTEPEESFVSNWRRRIGLLNESYAWLKWPHKVVETLKYVAILSFLFHAVSWLSLPVLVPVAS